MLVDCVTLPVLSGSVLSMHLCSARVGGSSMTWDARRLCDLTSFVWVGLVDASGLEQLSMR